MVLNKPAASINNNTQDFNTLVSMNFKNSSNGCNVTELSNLLQLSLDTEKILEIFYKYTKSIFKLVKLLYVNEKHDISIILGQKVALQCNSSNIYKYTLNHHDEDLGEIVCASKYRLSSNLANDLKIFLNLLTLPVRNSLLYKTALQATLTDPLTKLGNKLSLLQDLQYHFNLSGRYNSQLSLIFIDIDYFKKINDQYGHIIGDQILVQLSKVLKFAIRKSDKIYRFGGEEFVLILSQTNQSGAVNLASKLINFLNKNKISLLVDNIPTEINVSISLGVAVKNPTDTYESLMSRADSALYLAKNGGRNQFIFK